MGLWKLGWIPLFGWCSHWVSLGLGSQHFDNIFFIKLDLQNRPYGTYQHCHSWTQKPGCSHILCQRWHSISSVLCMDHLPDLADITTHIHSKLNKKTDLHYAIAHDNSANFKIINRVAAEWCTRWEKEAWGEFTIEGCIEMVWIMRFIKHRLERGVSCVCFFFFNFNLFY